MAHSIELLLDPDGDAHIRSIWSALALAGLPSHATLGRRFTAEEIGLAMPVVTGNGIDLPADVTGLRRWDSDERVDHLLIR